MWDDIFSLSQNACAQTKFRDNVPKRSLFSPRVEGTHVGRHFCPLLDTTHAQKGNFVKMFPMFAYLSQEFLVAMWDGISVPFIEHHACAEMKFGKNDPKRCPFTP